MLTITGSRQMRDLAVDLARAGDAGKGLSRKLRRNITASTRPIKVEVQQNARAIPARGSASTGLRESLAKATRIKIAASRRNTTVQLIVDGKRMPAQVGDGPNSGQQKLPAYMEGTAKRWRHPVFGNRGTWVDQKAHPFVKPAVAKHLPDVQASVIAAVTETAAELERGSL